MHRAAVSILVVVGSVAAHADPLTFERRLAVTTAVEKAYYDQRTGNTVPFRQAIDAASLKRRVHASLDTGLLLRSRWNTTITADMLARETARVLRQSHSPARLRALIHAAGDDSVVFEETVIRPLVTERLARRFFAADAAIHAAARAQAQRLRAEVLAHTLDPAKAHPARSVRSPVPLRPGEPDLRKTQASPSVRPGHVTAIAESPDGFSFLCGFVDKDGHAAVARYAVRKQTWDAWWSGQRSRYVDSDMLPIAKPVSLALPSAPPADDTWDNGSFDALPEARIQHTAVWTGSEMIVWGGVNQLSLASGYRYDPALDSWTEIARTGAPQSRYDHAAVWTGTEMIVYGGLHQDPFEAPGTPAVGGGRYNPSTDTWSPLSIVGAPVARSSACSGWTGRYLLYWAGDLGGGLRNDGARYEPATDTWSPISAIGAPAARKWATATWAGNVWVVWGGLVAEGTQASGARYDPETDTWSPVSSVNAPKPRYAHVSAWTGSEVIIWGGMIDRTDETARHGGRYDPATDTWRVMADEPLLAIRERCAAVWTGTEFIIWGGDGSYSDGTGARYDPVTDPWRITSRFGVANERIWHTLVWTGERVIAWGGWEYGPTNTGARYDPASDTWTPTSLGGQPIAREATGNVWTGAELLVWGGYGYTVPGSSEYALAAGARYDPVLDAWRPITTTGEPPPRSSPSAVWTGRWMIIWGGDPANGTDMMLDTGGRYDPTNDSWLSVARGSRVNAPTGRAGQAAVWTGKEMLIWAGYDHSGILGYTKTGALYNPNSNKWRPMAEPTDLPGDWSGFNYVWSGTELLAWGGSQYYYTTPGARYDPANDSWRLMTQDNAPSERFDDGPAIWTGKEMLIWGGLAAGTLEFLRDGARYDPALDRWTPISLNGDPAPRWGHMSVWTGRDMLVWGGLPEYGERYDPEADTWQRMSGASRPETRSFATMVYANGDVLMWGGCRYMTWWPDWPGCYIVDTGGRYLTSTDTDGDGVIDRFDDCISVPDRDQLDHDGDGRGDACETGAEAADADRSNRVDGVDLAMLGRAFGCHAGDPRFDARVDLTNDGVIDGDDLAMMAAVWGASVGVY
jgi:N-acetylneuraminic acid mutarotase